MGAGRNVRSGGHAVNPDLESIRTRKAKRALPADGTGRNMAQQKTLNDLRGRKAPYFFERVRIRRAPVQPYRHGTLTLFSYSYS